MTTTVTFTFSHTAEITNEQIQNMAVTAYVQFDDPCPDFGVDGRLLGEIDMTINTVA